MPRFTFICWARALGVGLLLVALAGCLSATRQRSSRDVVDDATPDALPDRLQDSTLDALADAPPDATPDLPPDPSDDEGADVPPDPSDVEEADLGPDTCPELPCSPGDYPELHPGPCQRLAWSPSTCGCAIVPVAEPTACDDANPCTLDDACHDGACVSTTANPQCECEPTADTCEAEYGDDDACTGTLRCIGGLCITDAATVPAPCSSAGLAPCQRRACVPATGLCAVSPSADDEPCSDGDACTLSDTCQGGQCLPGSPRECDDGDPCTDDACVPSGGACTHTLVPSGVAEACNGADDDCDGKTDEPASGGEEALCAPHEACVDTECRFSCDADADCTIDHVCKPAAGGLGDCVTACVASGSTGYGYRTFDGCHSRVLPTGADKCLVPGGWALCNALAPGDDGYGQDATFGGEHLALNDLGDGTVGDELTGAIWSRLHPVGDKTLAVAESICQANSAGLPGTGWALPSVTALFGLVDFGPTEGPTWFQDVFGDTGGSVEWSATPAAYGGGTPQMYVDFSSTSVVLTASGNSHDARCARLPAPSPVADRFVVNRAGDVVDRLTGLAWRVQNTCAQCSWYEGLAACVALGGAWRVPNAKEALSLLDYADHECSLLPPLFFGADCPLYEVYWTSTPLRDGTASGLDVGIGYLQPHAPAEKLAVRCVRSLP